MAKLLSSTSVYHEQRRFLVVSFVGRIIRVLDVEDGMEHTVRVDTTSEACDVMNFSDAEWLAWLKDNVGRKQ